MPARFGPLAIAELTPGRIGRGGVADSAISGVNPIAESAIPPGGVRRYSWAGNRLMRSMLAFLVASLLVTAAPALADQRSDAKAQVEFGIVVAKKNLWKEATQRWEHATKLDPTYAAAWNNLGIGYEQLGRFDEARTAYEKAMELEPGNQFFKTNYDYFREIYDRQNRRRGGR